jgi:predicted transcriptional regulator
MKKAPHQTLSRRERQIMRYFYIPVVPRDRAKLNALPHMLETFFDNSAEQAALLHLSAGRLSREKLDRLSAMIEKVRSVLLPAWKQETASR